MANTFLQNTLNPESRDFTLWQTYDLGTLKSISGAGAIVIGGVRKGAVIEVAAVYTAEAVVGGTTPAITVGLGSTAAGLVGSTNLASGTGTVLNTGSSFSDPNDRITASADSNLTITVTGVGAGATAGKVVVGFKILDLPRFAS